MSDTPLSKASPSKTSPSDTPLLDLRDVTVRFGGLTAVNQARCQVKQGEIYSIIGPNGAGKTTVFNVITGIYEPTEGTILFRGHEIGRPLTWKSLLGFLLIGLGTGIACALFALNMDNLWRATVRHNYLQPGGSFSYRAAAADAVNYIRGDLAIEEPRTGVWQVMTADGSQSLAYFSSQTEAEAARKRLSVGLSLKAKEMVVKADGARVQVVAMPADEKDARRGEALADYDSLSAAEGAIERLATIGAEARLRQRAAGVALLLGSIVGFGGAYLVWSRSRRSADVISRGGIARTFQNIRLFQNMTVLENVLTGMDRDFHAGPISMALHSSRTCREEGDCRRRADELIGFVGLSSRAGSVAKNLPYGDQRRLEIARALATRPELILLDEPAAGMNPTESIELMELIKRIRDRGVTVLLIEHHMKVVMGISDRVMVLDYGSKIAEGSPDEVRKNPAVIAAYLGAEEVH